MQGPSTGLTGGWIGHMTDPITISTVKSLSTAVGKPHLSTLCCNFSVACRQDVPLSLACAAAPRHQCLRLAPVQRCTSQCPSERALPHQAAAAIKRLLPRQGLRLRRFRAPALPQTPALVPTSSTTLCCLPSAQIRCVTAGLSRCVTAGLARGRCATIPSYVVLSTEAHKQELRRRRAGGRQ